MKLSKLPVNNLQKCSIMHPAENSFLIESSFFLLSFFPLLLGGGGPPA